MLESEDCQAVTDRAPSAATRRRGAVEPTAGAQVVRRPLPREAVAYGGGFLGGWQQSNRRATIDHCIEMLETAGNLDNLRRIAGESDAPFRGYWFADSDIYKVIEAVAWETGRAGDGGWTSFLDDTVRLLRAVQAEDGYLNSWIQGVHPDQRFAQLVESHEMYCAGHLIQAAVALARALGRTDLLEIAVKFADLLVAEFSDDGRVAIDGHPEIETALVELYRETGTEAYRDVALRLVELRGHGLLHDGKFGPVWQQDDAPVRDVTEARGHAVRQLYLAAGIVDLFAETGDRTLLDAMTALWESAYETKTYITGGQGSRHKDESFGDAYELPPDRAYSETCAGIASVMLNWRLLLATGDGRYGDELERALYNVVAGSTSLSGQEFFYSNPLHVRNGHDGSEEQTADGRRPWFSCACCPPNLARLVASLHHYTATAADDGLQVHLYANGTIHFGTARVTVETDYPWEDRVALRVDAPAGVGQWTLSLRVPAWSESASLTVDGEVREVHPQAGYVEIRRDWAGSTQVELTLGMTARAMESHPRVDATRGCVALVRGPIVYCIEQADHKEDVPIEDIRLLPDRPLRLGPANDELGVPTTIQADAVVVPSDGEPLYDEFGQTERPLAGALAVTAVPYFRWANRGRGAMRVWIPLASPSELYSPSSAPTAGTTAKEQTR